MGQIYQNLSPDEITQLEFQAGKKAAEMIDKIISEKLNIQLSEEDNGKILQVGADGKVVPMASSEGLTIDDTLSVSNSAADAKATGDAIAVAEAALAPTFSTSTAYTAGQYVWYDGKLYRFTTDHAAGSWNAAQVELAVVANDLAEDVSELKGTIDTINTADITWTLNGINVSTGANTTATNRVSSDLITNYPSIAYIAKGYSYMILRYTKNGTYDGAFDGSEWSKSYKAAMWRTAVLTIDELGSNAGNYNYRVAMKANNDADLTISDAGHITLLTVTDSTLTMAGKAADAKAAGDEIANAKNAFCDDYADIIKISMRGKNLYNIATDADNTSISSSGNVQTSTDYRLSDYIFIGNGGTFTLACATAVSGTREGAQYAAIFDTARRFVRRIACTDSSAVKTITLESGEAFVRLMTTMITGDFMVNMGSTLLTYEPYDQKMYDFVNGGMERAEIVGRGVHGNNLFNVKTAKRGYNISTTGEISTSASGAVSDYIYIGNGGTFSVKAATAIQRVNAYYMATYDQNQTFVRRVQITDSSAEKTVTLDPGEVYVRLVFGINTTDFMCNLGSTLLTYEPYYVPILDLFRGNVDTVNRNANYRFSNLEIPNFYTNGNAESVAGTELDAGTVNTAKIIEKFDDLVEANSNYIEKVDLGTASDGSSKIYLYKFIPEEIGHADQDAYPFIAPPKVIIFAGIHGYDTDAGNGDPPINAVCLYFMLKDLCDNWRTNDALFYLRWNVQFYIVPVLNPYGFNLHGRYNYNGVDINRNFPYGWQSGETAGTAAMSEAESVIAGDLIEANKDAIFCIDFHCTGGSSVNQANMLYTATLNESEMAYPLRDSIRILSNKWTNNEEIPNFTPMNAHGFVGSRETPRGYLSHYAEYLGVPGMIVENFQNYSDSGLQKNTKPIIKMGCEEIGNVVLNSIKYFEKNRRFVTDAIRTV